jgi:catechol 2,3-dioxygenase-like lactoylglutathione lyase family enzyme
MSSNNDPAEKFTNHGIVAPVGMGAWSGAMPALDGEGRRVIFVKLWAGIRKQKTYYLLVDAETGESTQFDPEGHDAGAFSNFLSPENKLYDTLDDELIEFDVATQTMNRVAPVPPSITMSFTMDDNGILYLGMYPKGELLAFDPGTRELTNFGPLAEETWNQYPQLAADDQGWIYAAIQHQHGNIMGFHPETRKKRQLYPEEKRGYTDGREAWRATDGKVYCRMGKDEPWYRLYNGQAEEISGEPDAPRKGHTTTVGDYGVWPDGSRFLEVSVPNRSAKLLDVGAAKPRNLSFDYSNAGVRIYSMVGGPDGKVYGATGIPLRVFRMDPDSGHIDNWGLAGYGGHVNQWVRQGDKLYGAVYSSGALLEYDPSLPFEDAPMEESANPKLLYAPPEVRNIYGRPFAVLAHPDGQHILIGGNPARGLVGGGMVFYHLPTGNATVLRREDLIDDQGVAAIAALPNGDLIVGTTTRPATGGTGTAEEAVIYRLNWSRRKIGDSWTPVNNLESITDLIVGPDGLVYGLAPPNHFFVLDPDTGELIHHEKITEYGNTTGMQAPRTMALGPDGGIYALFRKGIARIEPGEFTHQEIGRPGEDITAGILIQDGRLYFACGAHLRSMQIQTD